MKQLLIAAMLFGTVCAYAQDSLKRIQNTGATNAETKAGDRISDVVTAPLDNKPATPSSSTSDESGSETKPATEEEKGLTTFSKYDFIPGDRILYAHDFTGEAIGELPMGWNTDGMGEVVNED